MRQGGASSDVAGIEQNVRGLRIMPARLARHPHSIGMRVKRGPAFDQSNLSTIDALV
jgi:hypothetical protein